MKTRRALSSVVGTVFAIIALASVVTYVTYSLDILDKFNQGVLVRNEETLDRGKEQFDILSATIDNNKFNITISNTGTLPINITKMWVENKSTTDWVNSYDIKKAVAPDGILIKVGQSSPIYANTSNAYNIKLITERGNTKEFSVNSGITAPLYMQLHAIPSALSESFTTTLLFEVVNNMSSNDLLLDLRPTLQVNPSGPSADPIEIVSAVPVSYASLSKGETAYFKWVYRIDGEVGDFVTFTALLQNGYTGNTASATVTLQEVLFASQSATSIESEGFTCCKTPDNILVMHQETASTPGVGSYQLYSGEVENTGTTIDLNGAATQATFYTYNDTNTREIPKGDWKFVMRYRSDAMPDELALKQPTMIFHFNDTSDSSTGGSTLTLKNSPQYSAAGKHGNSGIYTFTGTSNQYMAATPIDSDNNIDTYPDSTAGWFKLSSTPVTNKMIIYRTEGSSSYYEIAINNLGQVAFEFSTSSISVPQNTCLSSPIIDTNWHHFVVVRSSGQTCTLYLDGSLQMSVLRNDGGIQKVLAQNNVTIGRDPNGSPQPYYFSGSLDYIMHWNDAALTAAEASALWKANYGNASHSVDIKIEKTDQNGNLVGTPNPWYSTTKYNFTFNDGKGSTTSWPTKNFTITNLRNSTNLIQNPTEKWTFKPNERLRATVTWNTGNTESLDMNWRIDDNLFADRRGSHLEIPIPSQTFPSYFVYDISVGLKFTVSNSGPNGVWMTYGGTRAVFDSVSGGTSYGGLVNKANTTTFDANNDSMYINVGNKVDLTFFTPKKIPRATTGAQTDDIVPGVYNMYINIIGYDDTGATVLKTFPVGVVRVQD